MQVMWDPENGEPVKQWDFDPDDVLFKDAQKIEKHYGAGWDQWLQGLQLGQMQARGVLLWYMLSLVHPSLQYKDVPQFRVRQLKVEMGVRELKALYERVKRMKLPEEDQERFELAFQADMADALKREGLDSEFEIVDGQLQLEGADELPKTA